jgi:hypothetical protein
MIISITALAVWFVVYIRIQRHCRRQTIQKNNNANNSQAPNYIFNAQTEVIIRLLIIRVLAYRMTR